MPTNLDLLTPAEAAYVANVSLRDINRVIDEDLLTKALYENRDGRRLKVEACALVEFYFAAAAELSSKTRVEAMARMSRRFDFRKAARSGETLSLLRAHKDLKPENCLVRFDFLTVDFSQFLDQAAERYSDLDAAKDMVIEDPEILGGTPVIKGTRIPVYDVAASVSAGLSRDRIRRAYPGLDERRIDLAAIYARAVPLRGRPPRPQLRPEDALVTRRTVARRRRT